MVETTIRTDEDVVTISKKHFSEYCKLKIQVERLARLVINEYQKSTPEHFNVASVWAKDIADILDLHVPTEEGE